MLSAPGDLPFFSIRNTFSTSSSLGIGASPVSVFYVMTGIRHRRSSQNEAVVYLQNGLTWNYQILDESSHWSSLQPHQM